MRRLTTAFLLALLLLSVFPAARVACAETTAAKVQIPKDQDPNDPTASSEERMRRQRAIIMNRINARQNVNNVQLSTATQALAVALNGELEKMRSRINELMTAAGPLLRQAYARPEPRNYKVEAQAKLIEGQEMQLVGYGDDEVMFSAPLVREDPASKIRLVGSFEFTAKLQPLDDSGKVQVEYHVTMDTPVLQTYNNGSGKAASSGQVTFRSGSQGKAVLKAGEAREIVRIGENTIKVTVTPE